MQTKAASNSANDQATGGRNLNWVYDLYRLGHMVSEARADVVREKILRHVVNGFSASSGCLALVHESGDYLNIAAVKGLRESIVGHRIDMGSGIMGKVAQQKSPLLLNSDQSASNPRRTSPRPSSAICWPLIMDGEVIGVLSVNRRAEEPPFDEGDLERGQVVVSMISVAVDNTRLHEFQAAKLTVLAQGSPAVCAVKDELLAQSVQWSGGEVLAAELMPQNPTLSYALGIFDSLMSMRDPELAKRYRQTAQQSNMVASRMRQSSADCEATLVAALLHDVGCLGLPETVMQTPQDLLDPEQAEQVRQIPLMGQAMLLNNPALDEVANLVRHQRECYDGSGFPDSLQGDAIPLGSRIIRVVSDFFGFQNGVLQAHRLTRDQASAVLLRQRDSAYDAEVVDLFLALLRIDVANLKLSEWSIRASELKPGMILARSVVDCDGEKIVDNKSVLDAQTIQRILQRESERSWTAMIYVRF